MNMPVTIDHFSQELESQKTMLATVLPDHMPVERFIRAALIAVQMNPKVLEADRQSLFMSLQRCAADGLIPDNKEAALVEFNTKSGNEWIKKIQYMPMVDGVLKRARQSGEIAVITARAVYENDTFDYWIDENGEHLNFRPNFGDNRGAMKLVFAMAKLKSGDLIVEPMTMGDIEKVKSASKTSATGPWKDWFERMALKSALHRMAKRLPNSSEIMEMLDRGNFMYDFDDKQEKPANNVQSITRPSLPVMDDEKLKGNYEKYYALISSGTKSADDIIKKLKSSYVMTQDQELAFKSIPLSLANGAA
jgi:recombination protein RecT